MRILLFSTLIILSSIAEAIPYDKYEIDRIASLMASEEKHKEDFKSLRQQTKCDICQMIKNWASVDSKLETSQLIDGKTVIESIHGGINNQDQVELAVSEVEIVKGECISTKSINFFAPLAVFKFLCKEFEKEQKESYQEKLKITQQGDN